MTWFRSRSKGKPPLPKSLHRTKTTEDSEFVKDIKKEIETKKNNEQRKSNSTDGS